MPHLMLQTCWPHVPAADVFEHLWPVCTQTVPGERRGRGCRATWQSPSRIYPGPFKSHKVIPLFFFHDVSSEEATHPNDDRPCCICYDSSFHRPTLPLGQVNTFHTVMIILQTQILTHEFKIQLLPLCMLWQCCIKDIARYYMPDTICLDE